MGLFGKKKRTSTRQPTIDEIVMRDKERREENERNYKAACAKVSDGEVEVAMAILADPRIQKAGFEVVQKPGGQYGHEVLCFQSTRSGEEKDYFIEPTLTERPTLFFVNRVMDAVEHREITDILKQYVSDMVSLGVYHSSSIDREQENTMYLGEKSYYRTRAGLQQLLFDLNALKIFRKLCQTHQADLERLRWFVLKGDRAFKLYTTTGVKEFVYSEESITEVGRLIARGNAPDDQPDEPSGSQAESSGGQPGR